MFEIKIGDVLESKETSEERDFLEQARRLQICDTIESLSDGEFVELQRSVHQIFMKVFQLQDIVKEGIEKGEIVGSIRNKLKESFQNSSESSSYYKQQYLNIEKFLAELEEKRVEMSTDQKEIAILKCKFFEAVEQSNLIFQNSIQSAIYSREDIKKRIYTRDPQLEGTKELAELCHGIRKELEICLKDGASRISTMEIFERVVQPLLNYQATMLHNDTVQMIQKEMNDSKKKPSISIVEDDSENVFDGEVQKLIDGIQKKFDAKTIREVIEFVSLLTFDANKESRLQPVIERLGEIQNLSPFMFKLGKNGLKGEVIEILRKEQEFSHERCKNIVQEQDDTKEKEEEKVQALMAKIVQKEFGGDSNNYLSEQELQSFAEVLRGKSTTQILELLENLKVRSDFRKFFADFCSAHATLTRQIEVKKIIREGEFDDAIDSILAKVDEKKYVFYPGKYNVNRVDLYEELASVRGVREEEIMDALLAGKAMKKSY